ncbi:MAG: tRNA uridine-5-carboxymethylaminomethyl(34) synthesis GTPase MnmE [Chlamydiia bacterium]|nr:tRNA uridine-5-carboxymethylaminomethyl(34) synthesis GTPase MnmE [Chlamydiia bacterium]
MHFVHRPFQKNDTIAAIATPAGEGAIAVIRMSGIHAFAVADTVFSGEVQQFATHTAHYGKILASDETPIDHVLLLVMKGPRSYTGEDTVEISCHGGNLIAKRVLERLYEAGARAADPGEFSFRAFLNGKIDLAQAEAVQQLIAAKNETAMRASAQQLEGALSKTVAALQKNLTDVSAILEAWVDFPEEGLEFASMEEICNTLETLLLRMRRLQATFHEGKVIHEGISLCLAGLPNVGKSSLMNALLKKDRAIVTPIAGTTRDLIEDTLRLGSLHFRLIDTAGLRETEELVEQEGIRRSRKTMQEADLTLLLLDASRTLTDEEKTLLQNISPEKTLIVWNKIDTGTMDETISTLAISAKEGIGLDTLSAAIEARIWKQGPPAKDEIAISHLRHFQALSNAIESCETVIAGLQQGISAEFVTSDMRRALSELGTIIGTNVSEDILSAIFSKFCLGK